MMEVEEQFAAISKALGNRNRITLLWLLIQCEHSVERLTSKTDLSFANVSQHLQIMRANGLVKSRRDQNRVLYRVADQTVIDMLVAVQNVTRSHFPEVNKLVYTDAENHPIRTIHPQDAWELLRGDQAMLLDARPREEYENSHLPGAYRLSAEEVTRDMVEHLNLKEPLIVYGRHAFCELPEQVISRLRAQNWNPSRLEGGLPEWLYGGWPIARG